MRPLRLLAFTVGLLLITQAARAQTSAADLYWSAGIGWLQPLEELRFVAVPNEANGSELSLAGLSGAPLLSMSLDLETSTFVDARGIVSYAWPSRIEIEGRESGSTAVAGASLQVVLRPWKAWSVRPYFALGGGVRHYRFGISSDDSDLCPTFCSSRTYPNFDAATGLDWTLADRRVFAEAQLLVNKFDSEVEEVTLQDGDIFRFQPGRIQRDLVIRVGVLLPL